MEIQQGNQFQANSTYFMKNCHKYGLLCYGDVNTFTKDKKRIKHCWIEIYARFTPYFPDAPFELLCIDASNEKLRVLPKDAYYRIAEVDQKTVRKITSEIFADLSVKHQSYGPFVEVEKNANLR
jgi:hypothetical protein